MENIIWVYVACYFLQWEIEKYQESVLATHFRQKIKCFVTIHHSKLGMKKKRQDRFSFAKVGLNITYKVIVCLS